MRRGVAAIVGSRIEEVRLPRSDQRPILVSPDIRQFRRLAVGRTVTAVERIGKRVVVCLNGDGRIVFEPRMTGLGCLASPPTQEHLRVISSGSQAVRLPNCSIGIAADSARSGCSRRSNSPSYSGPTGSVRTPWPRAPRCSPSGWAAAAGRSKSLCSISGPWPGSEICMPPKSFTSAGIHPRNVLRSALRPAAWQRLHAAALGSAARRDPPRRLDPVRWHLSQRAESIGRLPKPPPRLRSPRRDLPDLPAGKDYAARAGPAIDLLLSRVSKEIAIQAAAKPVAVRTLPVKSGPEPQALKLFLRLCIRRRPAL